VTGTSPILDIIVVSHSHTFWLQSIINISRCIHSVYTSSSSLSIVFIKL